MGFRGRAATAAGKSSATWNSVTWLYELRCTRFARSKTNTAYRLLPRRYRHVILTPDMSNRPISPFPIIHRVEDAPADERYLMLMVATERSREWQSFWFREPAFPLLLLKSGLNPACRLGRRGGFCGSPALLTEKVRVFLNHHSGKLCRAWRVRYARDFLAAHPKVVCAAWSNVRSSNDRQHLVHFIVIKIALVSIRRVGVCPRFYPRSPRPAARFNPPTCQVEIANSA